MSTPNLHHNLIQQLSELMDSVWRYEHFYKTDADACPKCKEIWEALHQRHEEDIKSLKDHLADHVKAGDW
ncbi:MAG: hypothetical protein WD940_01695 [Patescibacteria group bacterium]